MSETMEGGRGGSSKFVGGGGLWVGANRDEEGGDSFVGTVVDHGQG